MLLKESRYNTIFEYDNDKTVLYNSRTNIIADITGNKTNVLNLLNEPNKIEENNLKERLITDQFLVDDTLDEYTLDEYTLAKFENFELVTSNQLSLTILPTEQCNFRCPYCYEDLKNNHLTKEKEDIIIKYIGKNIKNYSKVNIAWFGGEPLLKKDSITRISQKVLEICQKNKKIYSSNIITNGYYLNLETFKEMLNNRILQFQITIDGPKKFHDKMKFSFNGKGSFDHVMQN